MKSFTQRVAFLFITLSVVNASRWWRDTGYDDALDGDAPEPQATQPPKQIFQGAVYPGIPPLNRTTGSGIYNLLNARQETPGCGVCNPITFVSSTPVCCNNGTYCCATGNLCQDEGWCCPRGKRACPGVRNVCYGEGEMCCGDGACPSSYMCCGGKCCPSVETICTADGQCISNQAEAASISSVSVLSVLSVQSVASVASQTNSSSSSSIDSPVGSPTTVSDPPASSSSDPVEPSVVLATSISNGVTLTVSRTVAPHVVTNNNAAATSGVDLGADAGDVVADVYPWDPRIVYAPEGAWTATTSESTVGNCHNGTRVATIAGATITFPFQGKQIAALICNGSKGGDYSIQVDGTPAVNLNGYKDPNVGGDDCILAQTFNSGSLQDGDHTISIIVKGSNAANAGGGTAVEFGGFTYRGPHAFGTDTGSKPNIPAIVGGTVGGVVGGILILTLIVVIVIRKRRNRRVDNAPAVHTIPVSTGTPYSAVPTTEYHDPYASSGYGPSHYPNPMSGSPQPAPAWVQTNQGPFGSGSFVTGH